ncbi:hypothetical protein [Flavobacterium sp. CS20]|uniref:hypothetical protein n=1 Tax=Flavobacterium sp. CS20 TaxID=2775246 RepID=UPI001B3A5A84|nr:hypothetical protein [Flavobacterium sp. CS20]QTY26877.1 hypothetical protein IGB25_13585 [Flavobacterium sp. CS20]
MKTISGLPNPKVLTEKQIIDVINGLPKDNNVYDAMYKQAIDSSKIMNLFFKGMETKAYIYNSRGELLCKRQKAFCDSAELESIEQSSIEKEYKICINNSENENLNKIIEDIEFFQGNYKNTNSYTVLYYWNFASDKKLYKEYWQAFKSSFSNEKNVEFIRINTDLSENWNLQPGKKLKLKLKNKGDGVYKILVGQMPWDKKIQIK